MVLGYIVFGLCSAIWLGFCIYLLASWFLFTPFYPSSVNDLKKAFGKIKENSKVNIPEKAKFIDLGSGDGRVVLWAAKNGMVAEGVEINPYLSLISKLVLVVRGVGKKTKIYHKSFHDHDYSDYDVVYLYIFRDYMDEIKGKLFSELKPGSVVISNTFSFSNLEPDFEEGKFKVYLVR